MRLLQYTHPRKPAATFGYSGNPAVLGALNFVEQIQGGVTIVVDSSNMFLGGRNCHWRVDFSAVRNHLSGDKLVAAHAVASLPPNRHRASQSAFFCFLQRTGWRVHTHRAQLDSAGNTVENEAAVDGGVRALIRSAAASSDVDSVVVLSGDGGMTDAVHVARCAGKSVYVVAWEGTLNPALAEAATDSAFIEELRPLIARLH